nr:hypothetical protein [Lactiplantibacillus plantarum]
MFAILIKRLIKAILALNVKIWEYLLVVFDFQVPAGALTLNDLVVFLDDEVAAVDLVATFLVVLFC